jgi:hypothetical protein
MGATAGAINILSFVALANAGTPLVWASIGQLLVGNLLIGIGEGWLLSRLFGIRRGTAMAWMVAANYVSLWLGWFLLPPLTGAVRGLFSPSTFFYAVPSYLLLMIAVTFVLTVVCEWPVCYALLFGRERAFRKSWAASLVAQSASYGFLVAYYLNASAFSLYTQVEVTPELLASLPDTAAVHFESAKDGEPWRVRLNGQGLERVGENERISRPARVPGKSRQVVDRRPPDASWDVRMGFFSFEGIQAVHRPTGRSFRAALDTPFLAWPPSEANLLPGDLVVCQLGPDQIVVLDLNARRLALLAAGHSPIVVLAPPPASLGSARP